MDDRISINGFSCRLPESNTPEEFWHHLIAGHNMVKSRAGSINGSLPPLPDAVGKIPQLNKFDAQLFGIHPKQADKMDPQLRLLLEVSYEALLRGGMLPSELKGGNTGVFIGACLSDTFANFSETPETMSGYENIGCSLSMFANRLSFYYDFHGPSKTIDTACSSSLVALDEAVSAIQAGKCDNALVGGSNLILRPGVSNGFNKLNMLSPDGACKSFDDTGNGYARAEGVVVLFISKKSLAKNHIANILATGVNNDGYTEQGISFPNGLAQLDLLKTTYLDNNINPDDINYIEAHGTGTKAGDPQELNALTTFFNKDNRRHQNPLMIGAVKSNMGHAEAASGLSGIVKVLLSMQEGIIPGNLHYHTPHSNIEALHNGSLKVIAKNQPWRGGKAGVSSFGFGGTNAHIVLEGYPEKNQGLSVSGDISLTPLSCRSENGLNDLVAQYENIEKIKIDPLQHQLVANKSMDFFPYRACRVDYLGSHQWIRGTSTQSQDAPIWFAFPGMGAQWQGMGKELMSLPIFSESIGECQRAINSVGGHIELRRIIAGETDTDYQDITTTFVSLIAIQIALVDLLNWLHIFPDGIIGHSAGEIACAYADKALNARQAILAAYWRGESVKSSPGTSGKMVAVQASWDELQPYCNDNLTRACHNSEYGVTLSGDVKEIDEAIAKCTRLGIKCNEVDSSGIAFHSPKVGCAATMYKEKLSELIPSPNKRSTKWLTTSATAQQQVLSETCSADYLVNNLLNTVNFYTVSKQIPKGATVIEIGAHSLLRAHLLQSTKDIRYLSLMRRDHDSLHTFYSGVAQAYSYGIDVPWQNLFPMSFPTPGKHVVNPIIDWHHQRDWDVIDFFEPKKQRTTRDNLIEIDINTNEFGFMCDHTINGRVLLPATGYLYFLWKVLSKNLSQGTDKLQPIEFKDIKFHQAIELKLDEVCKLSIRQLTETARFEILHNGNLVVSGKAHLITGESVLSQLGLTAKPPSTMSKIDNSAVYKELRLRGYAYGPEFQRLNWVSSDGLTAEVDWNGNWISCLDSLLHFGAVKCGRRLLVPTFIRRLKINPQIQSASRNLIAFENQVLSQINCHGVQFEGCKFSPIKKRETGSPPLLQEIRFVPYFEDKCLDTRDSHLAKEYAGAVQAYICFQFLDLVNAMRRQGKTIPQHLLKSEENILTTETKASPSEKMHEFLQHPNGYMMRLAHRIFADTTELLNNPLALIAGDPEYKKLYRHDLCMAFLFSQNYLGGLLDIVQENMPEKSHLNIIEAGAGTGGISHHILPKLKNAQDRYVFTDLSSGFFANLKRTYAAYEAILDFQEWNLNESVSTQFNEKYNLAIASNVIHAASNIKLALKNVYDVLSDDGFFILHEISKGYRTLCGVWGFLEELWDFDDPEIRDLGPVMSREQWSAILKESGFQLLACKDDGCAHLLFLCQKSKEQRSRGKDITVSSINDTKLKSINQSWHECTKENTPLWIHSSGSNMSGLPGLMNCLKKEPEGQLLKYCFSEQTLTKENEKLAKKTQLFQNIFQNNQWGSYRICDLTHHPIELSSDAHLAIKRVGDLSTLHWAKAPEPGQSVYRSSYTAINFKDIMHATGKLESDASGQLGTPFVWEFSGYDESNNAVMGTAFKGSMFLRGEITDTTKCIWPVPDSWSLQDAATVPIVYMTAYLALCLRGRIRTGQSILIHSGTGGVGQAAIRIAQSYGCEIFTTVGSQAKKQFLLDHFPLIEEDHIGNSHDCSFEDDILTLTNSKGVDIVLNSLSGEQLNASLRVLSRYGQFLEIGRYDILQNTQFGMEVFKKEIGFHGIGLDNVIKDNPVELAELINLVNEGLSAGVIQPLPSTVFASDKIEDAFRYMARGKHIGKVLINFNNRPVNAEKRFWCSPDKTWLITGGLGGFGIELTDWLIQKGAKHIVLCGRTGISNSYQKYRIQHWRDQGVHIEISTEILCDVTQVRNLLKTFEDKNPLGGIFHLAMVLQDTLFSNMDEKQFSAVCRPKIDAAKTLDNVSRELCKNLDYFVTFSSIVGSQGNMGQSNYGFANFAMDQLCRRRNLESLPALSIQWGQVGDVGYVHEYKEQVDLDSLPLQEQSISSCLSSLESLLLQNRTGVTSYVPKKLSLYTDTSSILDAEHTSQGKLSTKIASILGLRNDEIADNERSFSELGMDSLMAVEIQHVIEEKTGEKIKLPNIGKFSFGSLEALQAEESSITNPSTSKDIIQAFNNTTETTRTVYFINGIMNDSKEFLKGIHVPAKCKIYLVCYENAENMQVLADTLKQHINGLPANQTLVSLIGFSLGAIIAHRFKNLVPKEEMNRDVEFTSISPVNVEEFNTLQGIDKQKLKELPEEEAMKTMQSLPWYGDFPAIPFQDTINQFCFMIDDRFFQKEMGKVDHIILPAEDPICWPDLFAKNHADKVSIVPGTHDLRSINFQQLIS